ncbi:MAG: DUF4381 family protein [Gemmataceae bacterium]
MSGRYQAGNKRCFGIAGVIWTLLGLAGISVSGKEPTAEWTPIQKQGRGILYAPAENVKENHVEIRLSDSLSLAIDVLGDSDLEVSSLDTKWSPEGWNVLRIGNLEVRKEETAAGLRIRQIVALDPLKSGEMGVVLPPLRFRDRSTDGQWNTVHWQPLIVQVATEVLQADLQELRDVAPPEDVPASHKPALWIPWAGFILGSLAVLAAAFWAKRYWRRRPENVSPDQWALRELDQIDLPGLMLTAQEEKVATLVSKICRRYLDNRYQLNMSSLTTAEFLANPQRDLPLSAEQQSLVCDLLQKCDLAKFARKPMSQEDCQQILDMAHTLIKQTSQSEPIPRH